MTLSIHVCMTNPEAREYPYLEAIESYLALADEVIVVDGGSTDGSLEKIGDKFFPALQSGSLKIVTIPWPEDYEQKEFPIHLNAGLLACTSDWAMKVDIDYVIHEKSIEPIRNKLKAWMNTRPWASYGKFIVVDQAHGLLKTKAPFIINRKMAPQVRYGVDQTGRYPDWSWPVIPTKDHDGDPNVPEGMPLEPGDSYIGEDVWNYDYCFRTKAVAKAMFWRAGRAFLHAGAALWGHDEQSAWAAFIGQMKGREQKKSIPITLADHPKFIRDRIKNLTPEQFGHSHWGGNYA